MTDKKKQSYEIFISYRREGGAHYARILKAELEKRGFNNRVFLDYDELKDGRFDNRIMKVIDEAPIFIFILSPGCLDRCSHEEDWVRREIIHAMEKERVIIPVNFDGLFSEFPISTPQEIKDILGQHLFSKIDSDSLLNVSVDKLVEERIDPVLKSYRKSSDSSKNNNVSSRTISLIFILVMIFLVAIFGSVYYFNNKTDTRTPKPKTYFELGNEDYEKGNYAKAVVHYKAGAIKEDNPKCQYMLANCYLYGDGVSVDSIKAVEWYNKSSRQSYVKAQLKLAEMYSESKIVMELKTVLSLFTELEKNNTLSDEYRQEISSKIIPILEQLVDSSDTKAIRELASRYADGEGTEKNTQKALNLYRMAAENNDSKSCIELGIYYECGILGNPFTHAVDSSAIDYKEAFKWYKRGAELGETGVMHTLYVFYNEGRGVPKDTVEAQKWLKKWESNNHAF